MITAPQFSLDRSGHRICRRLPVVAAGVSLVFFALSGCGSEEKYQRAEVTVPGTDRVEGEVALRIPPENMDWARKLTEELDAAKLAYDLGDPDRARAKSDSLIRYIEAVIDTVPNDAPLFKFLLLFVSDAYGRSVNWQESQEAVDSLTHQFEALAEELRRRDTVTTRP